MDNDRLMSKYGEPLRYDPTFKGPLKGRSCTDIICLLLFILFIAGWVAISIVAFTKGDINRLLVPTSSDGLKCGLDEAVKDKPYLLFFDISRCAQPETPITGCKTPQVCVEKCPTDNFVYELVKNQPVAEVRNNLICVRDFDKSTLTSHVAIQAAINQEKCAKYYLKSTDFLKRCVSGFLDDVCPYIPSKYLEKRLRKTRDLRSTGIWLGDAEQKNTTKFITPFEQLDIESQYGFGSNQKQKTITPKPPADEPECKQRRVIGQEIVMEKMQNTQTYFSKYVENILIHFTDKKSSTEMAQVIILDIQNSYLEIFLGLGIAMFVSLFFIFLMRWIAAPVIWFSIFGCVAMLVFSVYYSATQYKYYKENPTIGAPDSSQFNIESVVRNWLGKSDTWLGILIVTSILLGIIVLVLIFLRSRIVVAIALVKEGSKAVSAITASVFFPLFPWILQILVISFSVAIALYLASVGDLGYKISNMAENCKCIAPAENYVNGATCNINLFRTNCIASECSTASCRFYGVDTPNIISYLQAYNIVGFFWAIFFISAFGEMVLASTFATWYWTFHKSDVPFFTVMVGMGRTVRYHLGTLAFGSLIITICRLIRLILEYIDTKLKKYDNELVKAIMCCCKCFFWCLEKFLKFLNKNAYIMCAIHGKNFCLSAKDAFNLLMRNFLRVIALDKVTDFLFFLSKILISVGMGYLTFVFYDRGYNSSLVQYKMVPMILVGLGTYLIATVFFNVYSMAVDTLFMCFLEDSERNDGSAEKPYFMSKSLMKVLGRKNAVKRDGYGRDGYGH